MKTKTSRRARYVSPAQEFHKLTIRDVTSSTKMYIVSLNKDELLRMNLRTKNRYTVRIRLRQGDGRCVNNQTSSNLVREVLVLSRNQLQRKRPRRTEQRAQESDRNGRSCLRFSGGTKLRNVKTIRGHLEKTPSKTVLTM